MGYISETLTTFCYYQVVCYMLKHRCRPIRSVDRAGGEGKKEKKTTYKRMISYNECYGVNICILLSNSYVEALISNVLCLKMGPVRKKLRLNGEMRVRSSSERLMLIKRHIRELFACEQRCHVSTEQEGGPL